MDAAPTLFPRLKDLLKPENVITEVSYRDIRFPTASAGHGSDSLHKDPNYSAAYVVISVQDLAFNGHGLTFTIGRGTEVVCAAIQALLPLVKGRSLLEIYTDFATFWHSLTCETQLRWIGPEKGAIHLAVAAVINALWDLWGKIEGKPVWQLLSDMTPEEIISLVDWQYLSDVLTKDEALEILRKWYPTREERVKEMKENGYPCYITSAGWMGYSDDVIKQRLQAAMDSGFSIFKMKVAQDLELDKHRCQFIRDVIGWDAPLMMDANQCWDVDEAIEHMTVLAEFKPLWIEEPTSPDDILGHGKIGNALRPLGIGIATGEHCHNRVMFKQFLECGSMDFCQIDSCRLGGVNEVISVLLMAEKFQIPVCPHAGGVGLCELSQHLMFFYYICVTGTKEKRLIEYADHLHEHFIYPVKVQNGCYMLPCDPGYSSEMKMESLDEYDFPNGPVWTKVNSN